MIKYFKTLWENNITPVNGRNLNKIEDALEYLYDVIRNVPSEENVRISNEKQRQSNETTRSNNEIKRNSTFDSKIKDVDKAINASNENILEVNNKFESITASKQQDAEVIIARDSESSLNARLQRDLYVDNIPLKQKVLDIEGLKEMQDLAYETNTGYKICENTKNGVVKDLKLYGKSLVNLGGKVNSTFNQYGILLYSKRLLSSNTEHTIVITNTAQHGVILYPNENIFTGGSTLTINPSETKVLKLNTKTSVTELGLLKSNNPTSTIFKLDVLVLEGDHTQNPPGYFEGIASVGNNNEIEVLSRKEDGNLLFTDFIDGDINSYTGEYESNNSRVVSKDFIFVEGGKTVAFNNPIARCVAYDANKKFIRLHTSQTFVLTNDTRFIKVSFVKPISNISMSYGNISVYQKPKGDKKTILFKYEETWKPVTELNEFDYIDTTKNEYSFGTYKFTVKGIEDWKLSSSNTTITRFQLNNPKMDGNRNPLICDKLPLKTNYEDITKEGCFTSVGGSTLFIDILTSKASTVEGLKTYLATNNMEFVSRAANIIKYEVNPLDLEAFENETMWMIESGPVSPNAEFKVTSSIQNFAKNTAERVDRLEDEVYKMNLANFSVSLNALELKSRLEALEAPKQ